MSSGNWFHILGPHVSRLAVPYVMVLWCLTRMSFGLTLGCSFGVNICEYIFPIVWINIIDCFKNFNGQNS